MADAAQAQAQQAALEAVGEVARLLALERREVAATGVLRGVLDARYMMLRPVLTRVVCGAALRYEGGWAAAELCMALLDAWRAAAGAAGALGAGELAPELAAAGLLATAVAFVKDPSLRGESSLKLLAERWALQVALLSPRLQDRLGARAAVLKEMSEGLPGSSAQAAAAIRAAQAAALVTLDWRVRRATARDIVVALMGVATQDTEVEEDALEFCSLGLLRGASLFYGQSVLAAASLRAARTVHGIEPAWPAVLSGFVPMLPGGGAEAEHCAQALLHDVRRRRRRSKRACDGRVCDGPREVAGPVEL